MAQLILCYWNTRGRTEPIRMLLHYLELPYTYKGYDFTQYNQWHETDKPALGADFPNLPYLKDGDEPVLTESDAIVQYACFRGNRTDLVGETPQQRVKIARFKGFVQEQMLLLGLAAYSPDYLKNKESTYTRFQKQFSYLNDYLSKNTFGNGDNICAYDFHLYDFAFAANKFFDDKNIFESYPNIGSHFNRIKSLPQITKYHNSDQYNQTYKIFGPTSTWNSDSTL